MALPFLIDCTGYFLFGTNQAASVANIVSAPNPLTVIGAPVYGSNYVRLLQADGYQTATNFAGYAYTGIAITTNGDRAANAGPTQGHFWLSRNAGAIRGFANPDQLFTTGGTPSIDSAGDTSKRPSTRLARMFEAKAISEGTTTATLMVQDGFSLREYARLAMKAQSNCRATLETLAKIHQPREQTVRHVHVNAGGQAVVAEEFHTHHAGGLENERADQCHEPRAKAASASPALPSPNALGNTLPMSGSKRKATLQIARRK